MQYDSDKLRQALIRSQATLQAVSSDSGLALSTVHRVINFGRGRPANVDAVAKALGFKNGRQDVMLRNGRRRSA